MAMAINELCDLRASARQYDNTLEAMLMGEELFGRSRRSWGYRSSILEMAERAIADAGTPDALAAWLRREAPETDVIELGEVGVNWVCGYHGEIIVGFVPADYPDRLPYSLPRAVRA